MADSFMSTHVLSQPGEYDGAAQSSAVKSDLFSSEWVGGSSPGSFPLPPSTPGFVANSPMVTPGPQEPMLDAPHAAMNTPPPWQDEHSETPGARRAARYDAHAVGTG